MQDRYVLGHTARELDRLDLQGALYRDATLRALDDAGIEPGMRVLDVGCGTGDVSRLVAGIVGHAGSVVGVDRDEGAIVAARVRSEQQGLTNVTFRPGEVDSTAGGSSFDALVGRFFLMHQPDPARTLSSAAGAVRTGGVVVMLESNMATLVGESHSLPFSSFYDEIVRWKCDVVRAAGADLESGLRLRRTFSAAGLPEPVTRMEAPVEGGPDSPVYRYVAESCRSMLPQARKFGIPGFDEEDVDAMEVRLRDEIVSLDGVVAAWPLVSAWCRVP